MPDSPYLVRATRGLADMDKALDASMPGAKMAAEDEDLPTEARPALREAVRAVEHAKKKVREAAASVEWHKKRMEASSAG